MTENSWKLTKVTLYKSPSAASHTVHLVLNNGTGNKPKQLQTGTLTNHEAGELETKLKEGLVGQEFPDLNAAAVKARAVIVKFKGARSTVWERGKSLGDSKFVRFRPTYINNRTGESNLRVCCQMVLDGQENIYYFNLGIPKIPPGKEKRFKQELDWLLTSGTFLYEGDLRGGFRNFAEAEAALDSEIPNLLNTLNIKFVPSKARSELNSTGIFQLHSTVTYNSKKTLYVCFYISHHGDQKSDYFFTVIKSLGVNANERESATTLIEKKVEEFQAELAAKLDDLSKGFPDNHRFATKPHKSGKYRIMTDKDEKKVMIGIRKPKDEIVTAGLFQIHKLERINEGNVGMMFYISHKGDKMSDYFHLIIKSLGVGADEQKKPHIKSLIEKRTAVYQDIIFKKLTEISGNFPEGHRLETKPHKTAPYRIVLAKEKDKKLFEEINKALPHFTKIGTSAAVIKRDE